MPPLSKKAFAKPTKICKTFKQPLLSQKKFLNIIHTDENPKKQHSSTSTTTFTTSSAEKKEKSGRKLTKKSVSMHLSFEEAQTEERSDTVSPRMIDPDGKDAYLKFVQSFSQSSKDNSICSTPLTKENSILSKSLDDLFKSVDRSDSVLLAESAEISQQVRASLDSEMSLSQEYLNQKVVKNAYLNCVDNLGLKDELDIIKKPKESAEISQQMKASLDSGVSLSQEYLNQKEVKNAYLECVDNLGLEKFGIIEKPLKKKPNKKSLDDSSKKKIKKPEKGSKALKENKNKDKSNCEKSNKEDKEVNKKRKLVKDDSFVETQHAEGKTKRKSKKDKPKTKPFENINSESMSLYDKMILIQESRNVGLYALCDICDKARYLPDIKDPLDLPDKWYCSMNPDKKHNKCSSPEEIDENEKEFLIDNLYNAGSIVWAKMDGYPWWPAMVEDDPDVEEYCWLEKDIPQPTWYHVTFFDSYEVTRAWLRPSCLKPFKINMTNPMFLTPKSNKFNSRIDASFKQAVDAIGLPLIDRLRKYSFIQRYPKPLKLLEKQTQSKRMPKKKNNRLVSTQPKKLILSKKSNESLVKCDDNISDILNTMDWQNDTNLNINLLE